MVKKYTLSGLLILATLIAGFIFLIRGCMSRYDERSAIPPVLYFEKADKGVVFSIVRYGKTISYKRSGGSTFKSLNTNYFIQANDAETGASVAIKKIKHSSDVKFYPITVLGTGNGNAWVFIGELLAYDPFTLEQIAGKETIESKNPQLKGKMPAEKNYYEYNNANDEIVITATDGLKYALSTASLLATAIDEEDIAKNPVETKMWELKKAEAALEEKYRAYYERNRAFNKRYRENKISYAAYLDSGKHLNRQQDSIRKLKTTIREEMSDLQNLSNSNRHREREIRNLKTGSKSYNSICTAVDTFNGKWYGLLSNADLQKPETLFRYRPVYTETPRNKFYSAALSMKDSSKRAAELLITEPEIISAAVYLQGGFLLNKTNALPIHLKNDDGFIICYREKVGPAGNIMLARVDLNGKVKWTLNTRLTEFADWTYTVKRLIILGNDNKDISPGDANLLMSIDLQNGNATRYDYFTDKIRKE